MYFQTTTDETKQPNNTDNPDVVEHTIHQYTTDITEIVDQTQAKIVSILSGEEDSQKQQSGVIYLSNERDCYVVTYLDSMEEETYRVRFDNDFVMDSEVIGYDPVTGVCVLRVQPEFLTENITLGNSDYVSQGEYAIVMSSRNMETQSSHISFGVVTAAAQVYKPSTDETISPAIASVLYSDVVTNDQCLGAPLCNIAGDMIGMVTQVNRGVGTMSEVLGISEVKLIVEQFIQQSSLTREYLGVIGRNIEEMEIYEKSSYSLQLDITEGFLITYMEEDSPLSSLGVVVGDVIAAINEEPVNNLLNLREQLYSLGEEGPIVVSINHAGAVNNVTVRGE